jgi:multidrug efflux pump subunit AcrB
MSNAHNDPSSTPAREKLGFSGSVARAFQSNAIMPLLAIVALLLGLFAVLVTPREEEPQINVTMAKVLIPFSGASSADMQQMVAGPAEQVLSKIQGIEHTYSVLRPGVAVLTGQFQVGVPRTEALVRLYDVLNANQDWLPPGLGVMTPIVKPKGIDDVPVLAATLWTKDAASALDLERVAHSVEAELKRVPGTREVVTIGGPGRAVHVWLEPNRLRERGVSVQALHGAIAAANQAMPSGSVANPSAAAGEPGMLSVQTGEFLQNAKDVGDIVVGVSQGRPIYLREVAWVETGAQLPQRYVWFMPGAADTAHPRQQGQSHPAVTITVTKKPGENAVDVAAGVRLNALHNTVIPTDMEATITRDYGHVTSRAIVRMFMKQIRVKSVPVLHGLHRRFAVQRQLG